MKIPSITPDELDAILQRAEDERWTELALSGRGEVFATDIDSWPTGRRFRLQQALSANCVDRLSRLSSLTTLYIGDNQIGEEGAKAVARLQNLTKLYIQGNDIGKEGAKAVARLDNLTTLQIWDNGIGEEGAKAVARLQNLTILDIGGNGIGDRGAQAIASLHNLTSLRIWNNGIGNEGAKAVARLQNLTKLIIALNELGQDGAKAIAGLQNLTALHIWSNDLGDEGAEAVAELRNLVALNVVGNSIGDEGAKALSKLEYLTILDIGHNRIGDEGAKALSNLQYLTRLTISHNRIGGDGAEAVLEKWSNRSDTYACQVLDLRKNGDLSSLLPQEALTMDDAQAILAGYRRFRDERARRRLQPLNEAKLLVVGNEAVGKTSLIRFLVEDKPRNPDEKKTPGTAIREKIETCSWSPEGSGVKLNIWDFGGQEIMHGTHRYFLTERSLYLLVLEDRRQDDRSIYEWMRVIRNRGGDSPVIVVINKSDGEGPYNLQIAETDFPGVRFLRTSCNDDGHARAGIAELRRAIADIIGGDERMRHVRDPNPVAWLRVKDTVSELAREDSVLTQVQFARVCEAPEAPAEDRITDPAEQRALLRVLHEMGTVVAHGLSKDAPASAQEITLLDPNWLTGAIYTILNAALVREQHGEFSREDLEILLDPSTYPPGRIQFILDMMQDEDIGLCFPLPDHGGKRYLVPDALSANEPEYGIWPEDSLRFRYRYSFLSPGMIPRFIVQAHRNLTAHPTLWKTGAVLKAEDCKILFRGDRESKTIDILVTGPAGRRRGALAVILNDLDFVHTLNPEAKPEARVPLPDEPQYDVSYKHLLKLEETHGRSYEYPAENASREYAVHELLDGVRWEKPIPENLSHERVVSNFVVRGDQVINLMGNVEGGAGGVRLQQGREVSSADTGTQTAAPGSRSARLGSWTAVSIACGVAAFLAIVLVYFLPSDSLRLWFGGAAATGVSVTVLMLLLNPEFIIRRLLTGTIFGGMTVIGIGGTIRFNVSTPSTGTATGFFEYDSSLTGGFIVAWVFVVGILALLELKNRPSG